MTPQLYTIYENPKDYPGKYVVRIWNLFPYPAPPVANTEPAGVVDSLDEARALIPKDYAFCVPRQVLDDAAVKESWLKNDLGKATQFLQEGLTSL